MFTPGVLASSSVPHPIMDTVIPIADIPTDSTWRIEEQILRNKLASFYRLVDLFRWSQSIYNHITVRVPSENQSDEILINPFGLMYNEITASSLIKVNLDGDVIDNGSLNYGINHAGYVLHSAVHSARPETSCVVHLHHPSVVAVSAQKCGLLPISQEAMIVGDVAYHDFGGIVVDENEKQEIVKDLGDKNVMILRNHGFVVCGETIEHALSITYHLIIACETQIKCVPNGIVDHLNFPTDHAARQVYKVTSKGGAGFLFFRAKNPRDYFAGGGVNRRNGTIDTKQYGKGELEWQAYMRQMDRIGYRTGHLYS